MLACEDTTGDASSETIDAFETVEPATFFLEKLLVDGDLDGGDFGIDVDVIAVEFSQRATSGVKATVSNEPPD